MFYKITLIKNIETIDNLDNSKFNILWFSAEWCKPCKELHLILDQIISSYQIKNKELYIYKIDVDKLETEYIINKLPTLIILDEQLKEKHRKEGLNNIKEFIELIDELKIIETDDF